MFGEIAIRKYLHPRKCLHPRTVDALKKKVNKRSRDHPFQKKAFYSELSSKPVNPEEAQCTSTSQKLGEWLIDSQLHLIFATTETGFQLFVTLPKQRY
ncbi:hypothetical protein AVEN_201594-1 [Araneus ventricosus]|uniref:Uncharacterized protein n=1 Tax=Araneus ventricosus TaxID=182803 RepID=A0A4Y2FGH5_ARAVE|nr:hypothetical protein AVEN_201594-1 [Araneus ventricosus]